MDESGFELNPYRPHAYARRGQKVHGNRSGKRGQRTNLILARQAGKLLSPMLFTGAANTSLVNQWVKQLLLKELRPNSTIILDNARFHNRKDLEEIASKKQHRLLFLPPYSPDFNPIEKTFAQIKRYRQSQPINTSMETIIQTYGKYLE
jgi:transposase